MLAKVRHFVLNLAMGIFNWALKGVRVDSRVPKTATEEAVINLEQVAAEQQVQAVQLDTMQTTPAQSASQILFERTEPTNSYGYGNQFSNAFSGSALGNRNILVITPNTNESVRGIVDNLQRGEACIICLEGIATPEAQRRLDFLGGVIYAINGSIKPLNTNTYILTPNGLGVK